MSDLAGAIAEAAGDAAALLALAIRLSQENAGMAARLAEMERAEATRLRAQRDRKQRSRGAAGHIPSRDVTGQDVTVCDSAGQCVTGRDTLPPPLSSSSSPGPLLTTPLPAPLTAHDTTPRARADSGTAVSRSLLLDAIGPDRMADVELFLATIGARNRDGWFTEMLRMLGPATGNLPDDLATACRHALLVEPLVKSPGPLRTFVAKERELRQRGPDAEHSNGTGPSNGNGSGDAGNAREMFAAIRKLITLPAPVPGQPRRPYIQLAAVEALGVRTATAYDRVGGSARFTDPREQLGFLLRDFEREYCSLPPDRPSAARGTP